MAKTRYEQLPGGGVVLSSTARLGRGGLPLLVLGSLLTIVSLVLLITSAVGVAGVCFMSVFVAAGVLMLGIGKWKFDAATKTARRLAPPTLTLPRHPLYLGECIDVMYEQDVRQDCRIERVEIKLICEEQVHRGRGKGSKTYWHKAFEPSVRVRDEGHAVAGETLAGTARFEIPAGAMHTFSAPDNKVSWRFELYVAVSGCPSYDVEYAINVAALLAFAGPANIRNDEFSDAEEFRATDPAGQDES